MGDVDDPTPDVRIGDRERRDVDARLQRAYADGVLTMAEFEERSGKCWAARTRGDLDPLIRDLPEPQPETAVEAARPRPSVPSAVTRIRSPDVRKRIVGGIAVAALAGAGLFAGSRALTSDDVVSVFGSQVVTVAPGDDRIEVGVVFGNVRVVVPADARVQPSGTLVFGRSECGAACDGSGQRDVVVDASGAFGSVNILRQGEQPRADDRDRDGDDDDDD